MKIFGKLFVIVIFLMVMGCNRENDHEKENDHRPDLTRLTTMSAKLSPDIDSLNIYWSYDTLNANFYYSTFMNRIKLYYTETIVLKYIKELGINLNYMIFTHSNKEKTYYQGYNKSEMEEEHSMYNREDNYLRNTTIDILQTLSHLEYDRTMQYLYQYSEILEDENVKRDLITMFRWDVAGANEFSFREILGYLGESFYCDTLFTDTYIKFERFSSTEVEGYACPEIKRDSITGEIIKSPNR